MIEKTFAHHTPTPEAVEQIRLVRAAYSDLLKVLNTLPSSREKSVAVTNLETSAMWAIKGLVCNDPASKVEACAGSRCCARCHREHSCKADHSWRAELCDAAAYVDPQFVRRSPIPPPRAARTTSCFPTPARR